MKLQASWVIALGMLGSGCLLPEEMEPRNAARSDAYTTIRKRQEGFRQMPIGEGDRFHGGRKVPQGLGQRSGSFNSILNLREIQSALDALERTYPDQMVSSAFEAKTVEGREIPMGRIGSEPRVFLTSGVHGRERGGPDNIIYFVSDLLWAGESGQGLVYGNKRYTPEQVETALGVGIVLIPVVNPDGVAFDQETNLCWRKNRNTAEGIQNLPESIGVDVNRNFAPLFDYKRLYDPRSNILWSTSDDPRAPIYIGPAPESEVETRSIAQTLRTEKSLSWFVDMHSFASQILYGWGDDFSQSTDPRQSFTNRAYDGKRGIIGDDVYKEYIEEEDIAAQRALSQQMAEAMNDAGGLTRYTFSETSNISVGGIDPGLGYPAQGSTDEALGQYYGRKCGANRINALTLEFGRASGHPTCRFYPDAALYRDNVLQTSAGLMELLLTAAGEDGKVKRFSDPSVCGRHSKGRTGEP